MNLLSFGTIEDLLQDALWLSDGRKISRSEETHDNRGEKDSKPRRHKWQVYIDISCEKFVPILCVKKRHACACAREKASGIVTRDGDATWWRQFAFNAERHKAHTN